MTTWRLLSTGLFLLLLTAFNSTQSYAEFNHLHPLWGKVLKNHVSLNKTSSTVQYNSLKKKITNLDLYLKKLSAVKIEEFKKFNQNEQLSFLINTYNAFTVKLILNNYPIKSIRDIGGVFSNPWKQKFFTLLGAKMNLDLLEHGFIRQDKKSMRKIKPKITSVLKNFNEPRIHFALNCASKGCPELHNKPYVPLMLRQQLEKSTRRFLSNQSKNTFNSKKNELHLSKIFKWYRSDFEKSALTVNAFVAPIMATSKSQEQKMKTAKIEYLEYDWSLNEN